VSRALRYLWPDDKQERLALIEDYRQKLVPLIVSLILVQHHLRRHAVPDWVWEQVYLRPYPKELMLRNHAQITLANLSSRCPKVSRTLAVIPWPIPVI